MNMYDGYIYTWNQLEPTHSRGEANIVKGFLTSYYDLTSMSWQTVGIWPKLEGSCEEEMRDFRLRPKTHEDSAEIKTKKSLFLQIVVRL